ncbi:hypothetical protein LPJ78_004077 [Coemansia sp. RSA 989]|nr:GPI biosynthesis protein family Pig-F-domain-containing protein [Coemansia mojavensis]KAJ1741042.1 hypothetical protein LPJ68_003208 [Coemansia sp. RSA 1086]KAJ1749601.1 hypothetical protein LPJ79_003585 [Coemansia sp. RSA 1821]KAJ1863405.1 hypothetical protein LPJ78_004077 [Coemansia sp. RSA 989]KAJ2646945.1 hypothetical protein IWW40_005059 [Coemansia sp. RSA 1250]KAJ2670986.1 hypothetical protein IWW42_003696 [Coemansia sp. RSA 1085]
MASNTLQSGSSRAKLPVHKRYPLDLNGAQLVLAGFASSIALATPHKSINLYENPSIYLCFSASVLFLYYAVLVLADVYCYKVSDPGARRPLSTRAKRAFMTLLSTLALSVVVALVFVLFGAPVLTQHSETFMAAVNFSLLAITPAILTLKPTFSAWRRALLSAEQKSIPEKWAAGFFWCTAVTTWASAYFIPMDWDRPWQRWPLPVVGGAFLGNLISLLFVLIRCFIVPVARADYEESENEKRRMVRELENEERQSRPVTRSMAKKDL